MHLETELQSIWGKKLIKPKREIDKLALCLYSISIDRSGRQIIAKDVDGLNITSNQLESIDIYEGYPTTEEYTFSWSEHEAFTKIEDILGQKTYFNEFKCVEIEKYILTFYQK